MNIFLHHHHHCTNIIYNNNLSRLKNALKNKSHFQNMYRISNAGKTLAVQKSQILQIYWNKHTNISYTSQCTYILQLLNSLCQNLSLPNTDSENIQVICTPKRLYTRKVNDFQQLRWYGQYSILVRFIA